MPPWRYFSILIALQLTFVQFSLTYTIDDSLPFTKMVEKIPIAEYFKNATVYHPLYESMAKGTLPEGTYKALIQQDHLYIDNFLDAFSILAKREEDPERKKYLQGVAEEDYDAYWQGFYDKLNVTKAVHMVPPVLGELRLKT